MGIASKEGAVVGPAEIVFASEEGAEEGDGSDNDDEVGLEPEEVLMVSYGCGDSDGSVGGGWNLQSPYVGFDEFV